MKESQTVVFALGEETLDLNQVRAVAADHPNKAAYDLLAAAFPCDSEGNLYLYPVDRAGVAELESAIGEIERAVTDKSDVQIDAYLRVLHMVHDWSTRRHWTVSWKLILAVIAAAFIMSMCSDSSKEDRVKAEKNLNTVKEWVLPEGKPAALDINSEIGPQVHIQSDGNLEIFRTSELARLSGNYKANMEMADRDRAMADTATIADKKKSYLEQEKRHRKAAENYLEQFNQTNSRSWKELHKQAVDVFKGRLAGEAKTDRRNKILYWFCLLLIPFYAVAQRPYGYTIMRCSREAETLHGIQRLAMTISGGLFAIGAGIGFVDIITKWSDGSTTRTDDGTGPVRMVLKIALFAAAIFVICAASVLLMSYATVVGLIRNYDWKRPQRV